MVTIGLLGKKSSGKSTAANYLSEHGYEIYSLATPLKILSKTLYKLSDQQLYGNEKEIIDKRYNCSPRYIMQYIGTDIVRKYFGKDYWLTFLAKYIADYPNKKIVIDDVRFQNEVNYILALKTNSCIIKITSGEIDSLNDNHVSEKGIDNIKNYSYKIINCKNRNSVKDFQGKILKLLNENIKNIK